MARRGHLRLRLWAGDLGGVTGGWGRYERRKKLLCVGGGEVRGGQRMKRPEVERVIEGLGDEEGTIEGSGSADGLRAVGEDAERGSGGGRV